MAAVHVLPEGVTITSLKTASTVLISTTSFFFPTFLAALLYFRYDLYDPETQVFDQQTLLPEYDFIVVGGGSAGNVVVNRLTENNNWTVLLLEAGGYETELTDVPILSFFFHKTRFDWNYRTQPSQTACLAMKDKRCVWTRGKVLGGSSTLNTMLYVRGNRRDFDQWAADGNPGWSYEDVLPYFKKSMDQRNPYLAKNKYHATGGYLTVQDAPWHSPLGVGFLQAGEEMGYDIVDYNGEQQTGFSLYQYTMRRGTRCSTAKAFLSPIKARKNLHVSLNSQVTRVLINPQSRRAYGVEYLRNGVKSRVHAKKEVVLSGGALNTPQLLMLSGIGPRDHLTDLGIPVIQDSPGVGQNLQDHIGAGGILFTVDYPISFVTNRIMTSASIINYATQGKGPLTSSTGLETVAFITTKYGNITDDWPDIGFMLTSTSTPSDGGKVVRIAQDLTDEFYEEVFSELNYKDMFGILPMILRPKSRGFVKLRSANPLEHPLFYHNYLTHPDDVRTLREGVKAGIAIGETEAMKRFGAKFHAKPVPGCRQFELFTDEYWECFIRQYTCTIYHYSGTAKMGPSSDPMAVVDPSLLVYGVTGLRVIDASIMPRVTSGNTNAPTIMIGEKGADMIKANWTDRELERGT
ncbi:hypothetical protein WDU94_013480 [Cyamophila willieti]